MRADSRVPTAPIAGSSRSLKRCRAGRMLPPRAASLSFAAGTGGLVADLRWEVLGVDVQEDVPVGRAPRQRREPLDVDRRVPHERRVHVEVHVLVDALLREDELVDAREHPEVDEDALVAILRARVRAAAGGAGRLERSMGRSPSTCISDRSCCRSPRCCRRRPTCRSRSTRASRSRPSPNQRCGSAPAAPSWRSARRRCSSAWRGTCST